MSGDDLERIDNTIVMMIDRCYDVAYLIHRAGDLQRFLDNLEYNSSVSMMLGQIGEGAKKIYPWLTSNTDYDWSVVIKFRDFIYHNYSKRDDTMVWNIANNDVPNILQLLEDLHRNIVSRPLVSENKRKRGVFGLFRR